MNRPRALRFSRPAATQTVHSTIVGYGAGFVLSLVLTTVAYALVRAGTFNSNALQYTVIGLGLTQALVQLLFFLHLGTEREPRWKLLVLDMMLLVVAILVIGSLWIMDNLNYNMTSNQADQSIVKDEGVSL